MPDTKPGESAPAAAPAESAPAAAPPPAEAAPTAPAKTEAPKTEAPTEAPKTEAAPAEAAPTEAPKEEAPKEEAAPTEGAKAEPLEVKMPEGFEADEGVLSSFLETAKSLGLKGEQAQKLVDAYAASEAKVAEREIAEAQARVQQWQQTVKDDPEMGGPRLAESLEAANRALSTYGNPELVGLLKRTGLSNHPDMVRLMARVGRAMSEDSSAGSMRGAPSEADTEEARLERMYPSMKKR